MEALTGSIYKLFETKQGVSKAGKDWKAKDMVISVRGGHFLLVTAWNDKADSLIGAKEGQEIEFDVFVKSREYQGKWYTECNLTKIQFTSLYDDVKKEEFPEPEPPDSDLPF